MVRTLFAITSLLLLWVFVGPTTAQPKEPAMHDAGWPRPVTGLGANQEKAKKDALQAAIQEIKAQMKKQSLTSYEPTEEFVTAFVLDGAGKQGQEKEIVIGDEKLRVQEWTLAFRTDTNWWKEIVRRDQERLRKINAEERQWFAGRLVFGLAVVLLSGFGYVQLDRQTQHRYTTWLRVAGVGLVSVVLAAFWWIVNV